MLFCFFEKIKKKYIFGSIFSWQANKNNFELKMLKLFENHVKTHVWERYFCFVLFCFCLFVCFLGGLFVLFFFSFFLLFVFCFVLFFSSTLMFFHFWSKNSLGLGWRAWDHKISCFLYYVSSHFLIAITYYSTAHTWCCTAAIFVLQDPKTNK